MYATWARASRSAVRPASKLGLAARLGRPFHASAPARAAADATDPDNNNNNESQDGADKSKDSDSAEVSQENTKDENLLGEKGLDGNGDTRGRQRRPNAASKPRASRHRTPQELPPIRLPAEFYQECIYRYGDLRKDEYDVGPIDPDSSAPRDAESLLERFEKLLQDGSDHLEAFDSAFSSIFEAASWSQHDVQLFTEDIQLGNIEDAAQRGTIALIAAWSSTLKAAAIMLQDSPLKLEEFSKTLQMGQGYQKDQLRKDRMKIAEMRAQYAERIRPYDLTFEQAVSILKNTMRSKIRYESRLGLAHQDALYETTSSIRADFAISSPKNIKVADLKRPVTILHFPYYDGFEWPKYIMQDIAAEVEADVVHITAQDIAHIAGAYLGQDTTRAPGPLSLLGYKTAENASRITRPAEEHLEEDLREASPFSIVIPMGKPKKEGKKKMSIMDYVLTEPSRGKSDEMWVDLKLNAVLEEMVHAVDSDSAEQRPLIVHIHDINALSMDEDCGALVLGKLRKIVDDLWVDGKKVVLVGTCSRSASTNNIAALRELRKTDRVIDLHPRPDEAVKAGPTNAAAMVSVSVDSKPFIKRLKDTSRKEYLDENTRNIATMLRSLLDSNNSNEELRIDFTLQAMDKRHRPKTLSTSLLPVSEVYRVVKTMIGLRRQRPEVFSQAVLEEALRLIKHIDSEHERQKSHLTETASSIMRQLTGESGGSLSEYEKRFMSALVNPNDLKTTFKDIHAPPETIDSIKMLTQLSLLRPEAFAYGVLATDRIPGCLLYGPPGTGKTLLAKAVAKESGANMIEVSGASINQMYVGESEKNIRALFSLAKKKEPLVIFIDEADALLGARGGRNDAAGRRDVINQFLREWDGMESSKAFIMVATNRPFDLDEAVLRRLPRKLLVDLPLEADRAAILKIHLKNEALDDTVAIEQMAKQTALYSGSDLKNVCVAAAMAAVKEELQASEKHTGPEPYVWPAKRILNRRHFDKALSEIPASASEDMATLGAIKKFDERYGEKKARRKRRGMGFEVVPEATDSHEARVRSADK
ncbi:hypothetical protein BKA67DRAFT_551356 [Truncatella angustata]|uniref:AAA+ ATPase domain-containing protein n=1 Tax=Truncatella angustata TaxID=152316 RepID=A0A9P8ZZP4_9PEZI|nr:uncharacterized protein BKA67DRAFT_551356 [Truncatella angustata]KAH6656239.1 hypothetical protein BKA67DRAFT_551356 [Truncatella angustata]